LPRTEGAGTALPGFGALFQKELLEARRSRRMIAFLVIMTAILLLVPVIGYLKMDYAGDSARHQISGDSIETMLGTWAILVGFLGALMVIAGTLDAVSGERSLGITAWIITKPVSRVSYLTAKGAAHACVAVAMIVAVPSLVWLAVTIALFQGIAVGPVLVGMGILALEAVVFSFFTVALGVPFRSIAPITIAALGLWFVPNFLVSIAGDWTRQILPSFLPEAAYNAAISDTNSATWTVPVASVALAAIAFGIALLRFEQQEL
jgi:ABC-type transport system involved in multi-copper enzyme maturation permease subunit